MLSFFILCTITNNMKILLKALIPTVAAILGGKVASMRTARKVETAKEEVRRAEALSKAAIIDQRESLETQLLETKRQLKESQARELNLAEVSHTLSSGSRRTKRKQQRVHRFRLQQMLSVRVLLRAS